MKIRFYTILVLLLNFFNAHSQITPEIYSWQQNTTATGYNGILTNVQQVAYNVSDVYVSATCIPGYDIGPWAGNPNLPANQNFIFKITRNPVQNTGTLINTPLGHIGVFSNGVSIYNPKDGMSYMNQNVWQQNAIIVEGPSFDDCLGHPAPNGEYHHHLNPTCLYNDSIVNVHSPIIGYAFDGFPIYGAYAYTNTNGSGPVKRMQSSYQKRNITVRTTLPDGTPAANAGPVVSSAFPIGYYIQDYEYTSGSGDLDEHNGRFCVTPDYPSGIYCYFVTLDSNLVAEYPYLIGPTYYGTVQPGNTGPGSGHNTIPGMVTIYTGTIGMSDFDSTLEFDIFPNPARHSINIALEKGLPGNLQLDIIDITGKVIYTQQYLQPTVTYSINISSLSRGIFLFRLKSDKTSFSKKVIIE